LKKSIAAGFFLVLALGAGCDSDYGPDVPYFGIANTPYETHFTCSQTPTGGAAFCAHDDASKQIRFAYFTGIGWDIEDDANVTYDWLGGTGFMEWTATHPGGFTEEGAFTFSATGSQFIGTSTYTADDGSYTGECNYTGAVSPAVPPAPPAIGACP
jgi:hypothetical protein